MEHAGSWIPALVAFLGFFAAFMNYVARREATFAEKRALQNYAELESQAVDSLKQIIISAKLECESLRQQVESGKQDYICGLLLMGDLIKRIAWIAGRGNRTQTQEVIITHLDSIEFPTKELLLEQINMMFSDPDLGRIMYDDLSLAAVPQPVGQEALPSGETIDAEI